MHNSTNQVFDNRKLLQQFDQTDNENDSLVNYIHSTFDEQALRKHVMNIEITCPHCKKTYKGVYELDNFFIF